MAGVGTSRPGDGLIVSPKFFLFQFYQAWDFQFYQADFSELQTYLGVGEHDLLRGATESELLGPVLGISIEFIVGVLLFCSKIIITSCNEI